MFKLQNLIILMGLGLFLILYFGLDVKPKNYATIERDRQLATQETDITNLIRDVQGSLSPNQASLLVALEQELEQADSDSLQLEILKQLSGKWFEYRQPHIAGFYAEQVAEIESSSTSWAIAGTSYAATFKGPYEEKVKKYSLNKAITAFENAISLDPSDLSAKVNLALCYVERPPEESPMKGILLLLDYDKQFPDNPMVLFHLGRLGLQTGQYEKAIRRLEKVIQIAPKTTKAYCLLAKAYEGIGDSNKASQYLVQCNQ